MHQKPAHAPLDQFPVINDELHVGGMPVARLADKVGQTPFYAYDREAMSRRVHELREQLPKRVSLHYAIKANPMPAVVDHLAARVDGLDVASLGELRVALASGMSPAEISFAGPGKTDAELKASVVAGITLNVESAGELARLLQAGEKAGTRPRAAIRVNPDFELKSSGMKMGGGPKPFGIDAEAVPGLLRDMREMDIHFRGFHIFSGSQNLKPESLVEAHDQTFALAARLAESAPSPVEVLNIGGGFGIPYFPGEQRLQLHVVCANLERLLDERSSTIADSEVVIELGRYLVGEAGVYVSEVIDRKVSRGHTFLVTNGGLHHHLAASGNFGQVIRKNYPVVNPANVHQGERELVSVVGPLCTPLDILGDRVELGRTMPGDLVVLLQSGAYGFTASPQAFLGHPAPVEVLV